MKKIFVLMLAAALAAVFCGAAAAGDDWDTFVAQMENRQKIKSEGPAFYDQIALLAPAGSERELWELSCSAPNLQTRAAASAALVKKWFPEGDPANWQQVTGFFPPASYVPRQIVAVNALFNAVTALSQMPEGKYAAAYLMRQFAQSSMGKLIFIDNMPAPFRKTLDSLLAETDMGGYWASSKIEGPYPFVPVYNGVRTYDYAMSRGFQFLNGFGGIAESGPYAWDRANGFVYRLVDPSVKVWDRD